MEDQNQATASSQSTLNIISALKPFFQGMSTIGVTLLSIVSLGYLVGWVSLRSYLSTFGAEWLLAEFSHIQILSFSSGPLCALVFLSWLKVQDIVEVNKQADSKEKFTKLFFLLMLALAVGGGLEMWAPSSTAKFVGILLTCAATLFLFLHFFQTLLIRLCDESIGWNFSSAVLVFGLILFGLYMFPLDYGETVGWIDHGNGSTLAKVHLKEDIEDSNDFALLLFSSGYVYLCSGLPPLW